MSRMTLVGRRTDAWQDAYEKALAQIKVNQSGACGDAISHDEMILSAKVKADRDLDILTQQKLFGRSVQGG